MNFIQREWHGYLLLNNCAANYLLVESHEPGAESPGLAAQIRL
jgi:hypothetical protein